ncbi:MAG: respiratory nitrate reductase subunit gamma [Acidobacteria bacterium]|nr:respiratory nitrate reductase subunit gamma [Acidobacteriota bacterium]
MLEAFLFVGYPYAALVLAVVVGILRFTWRPFSYSSLSSQFLENKQLFWGSGLWHWGILWVLAGHFVAFLVPDWILAWNAKPLRLYLLEASGLIMALLALMGIISLMVRRATSPRVKAVTTVMDWVLLAFLLLQVYTGIDTALRYRWGSSWYASNAVPYLRSLLMLSPKPEFIRPLPWMAKVHLLSGLSVILLLPFSRLVHVLVVPIWYYWRKPQVVIWNRRGLR